MTTRFKINEKDIGFHDANDAIEEIKIVATATGEVSPDFVGLPKKKRTRFFKDSAIYVKLFADGIDYLKDFGKTELKVFCFILRNIKPCTRVIEININECMNYTCLSERQVKQGLLYLCDADVLHNQGNGFYEFNINLFFNGNRNTIISKQKQIENREIARKIFNTYE